MIIFLFPSFRISIIERSVVDFPDPVGPLTSISPNLLYNNFSSIPILFSENPSVPSSVFSR